jgi:hypothetical protein
MPDQPPPMIASLQLSDALTASVHTRLSTIGEVWAEKYRNLPSEILFAKVGCWGSIRFSKFPGVKYS